MLNVKEAIILTNKLYEFAKQFQALANKTSVMPNKVEASKKYADYVDMAQQAIAYITMQEAMVRNAEFVELQNQILLEALVEKQKKLNRYTALEDLIANDELDNHIDRVKQIFKELNGSK